MGGDGADGVQQLGKVHDADGPAGQRLQVDLGIQDGGKGALAAADKLAQVPVFLGGKFVRVIALHPPHDFGEAV